MYASKSKVALMAVPMFIKKFRNNNNTTFLKLLQNVFLWTFVNGDSLKCLKAVRK